MRNAWPKYTSRTWGLARTCSAVPEAITMPRSTMYARPQTPRVSRTLWSVTRTPMPRAASSRMMRWMSSTESGSTPAKGSSSRMKRGSACGAHVCAPQPPQQFLQALLAASPIQLGAQFQNRHTVVGYREPPKDGGLLRQVPDPEACALIDAHAREVLLVEPDRAAVGGHQAHHHVE